MFLNIIHCQDCLPLATGTVYGRTAPIYLTDIIFHHCKCLFKGFLFGNLFHEKFPFAEKILIIWGNRLPAASCMAQDHLQTYTSLTLVHFRIHYFFLNQKKCLIHFSFISGSDSICHSAQRLLKRKASLLLHIFRINQKISPQQITKFYGFFCLFMGMQSFPRSSYPSANSCGYLYSDHFFYLLLYFLTDITDLSCKLPVPVSHKKNTHPVISLLICNACLFSCNDLICNIE